MKGKGKEEEKKKKKRRKKKMIKRNKGKIGKEIKRIRFDFFKTFFTALSEDSVWKQVEDGADDRGGGTRTLVIRRVLFILSLDARCFRRAKQLHGREAFDTVLLAEQLLFVAIHGTHASDPLSRALRLASGCESMCMRIVCTCRYM